MPALLGTLQWNVSWHALDATRNDLADNAYVVGQALDAADKATITIFPLINDLVTDPNFDLRFIEARLTLTTDLGSTTRKIGPTAVRIIRLSVPTVAAFSESSNFTGFGLVVIQPRSQFTSVAGTTDALRDLQSDLARVRATPQSEDFFRYTPLSTAVTAAIGVMSSSRVLIRRGDLPDLADVCYRSWSVGPIGPFCRLNASRQLSSMAVIGRNAQIDVFNLPKWNPTHGALSIRTGDASYAIMSDFASLGSAGTSGSPLNEWPAEQGVTNVIAASTQEPHWNDRAVSLRWVLGA
jgi:hypothetical protein